MFGRHPKPAPEPALVAPQNDTSMASVEKIWVVVWEIYPGGFSHRICLGGERADKEAADLEKTYRNVETYRFEKVYR